VARATDRAVVAETGRLGLELYPVQAGRVLEEAVARGTPDDLETTLAGLRWPGTSDAGHDWPWLVSWLQSPRRKGAYVVWREGEAPARLAARIQAALAPSGRGRAAVVT
jgi:hypothetical protein